jgi:hypothetical protein
MSKSRSFSGGETRNVEDGNEYDSSFEKVVVDVPYIALLCYVFEVPFDIC